MSNRCKCDTSLDTVCKVSRFIAMCVTVSQVRMSDGDMWKCQHRYSAFKLLNQEVLQTTGKNLTLPSFPTSEVGLKKEQEQVNHTVLSFFCVTGVERSV